MRTVEYVYVVVNAKEQLVNHEGKKAKKTDGLAISLSPRWINKEEIEK